MNRSLLLALVTGSMVLSGCGKVELEERNLVPKVRIYEVGGDSASGATQGFLPAVASAADRSHLSFRVSGEVQKLNVSDGDRVTKGQVIAELDPTDYQLDVDNAQASFNVADSQYRRSESLVKKGLLAQSQFDELAAQRMIAKSALDLAKLRLSFTKMHAPMDGIISRVNVEQFENVQVGQQIVNIHNVKEVDIVVQIADQLFVNRSEKTAEDIANFEATVRVSGGAEYTAKIKEFTTEPDPQTATYMVTMTMPMPKDQFILDGMAVEVAPKNEQLGQGVGLVNIPLEAVFNPDGDSLDRENKYVWLLNDDETVSIKRIVTGTVHSKYVQVPDGLENGQKIVVAGISKLKDGIKVEPISQEGEE